jgi:hypothetical protein
MIDGLLGGVLFGSTQNVSTSVAKDCLLVIVNVNSINHVFFRK